MKKLSNGLNLSGENKMLKFNQEKHQYTFNGLIIPSVSEIVNIVCGEFKGIINGGHSDKGTAIHLACHYLDNGILDWGTLEDDYVNYIIAWEDFKKDFEFDKFDLSESKLYSPLGFAGTPDKIGNKTLIDIKTGAKDIKRHIIQMAGYGILAKSNGIKVDKYMCVYLHNDGRFEHQVLKITSKEENLFLQGLNILNYRKS